MTVIAIVNRKGGSGKSTLATHVAGYLAARGLDVMLGDVDKQQSSRLWLNLRPEKRARIQGWTIDERNFARPPAGVKHVVLDTPGGFQSIGLMKVAMYADAILIPTTSTIFDRAAAFDSVKELRTLPRVATGKCKIACVGLRIDGRTKNAAIIQAWANDLSLAYLGSIKAAQAYGKCMENGLCIFDYPHHKVEAYLQEWTLVTGWLDSILSAEAAEPKLNRPVESRQSALRPVNPVVSSSSLTATNIQMPLEVPDFLRR